VGKAIDNRAACAILIALLEKLADGNFPGTFWAVGTVQEERGWGRENGGPVHPPRLFIALDAAWRATPRRVRRAANRSGWGGCAVKLGISWNPQKGYFIHPGLKKAALEIGQKGIPIQWKAVYGNSYTDAAAVSQEGTGIPSIALGFPMRYSHAPSSVCHLGTWKAACAGRGDDSIGDR